MDNEAKKYEQENEEINDKIEEQSFHLKNARYIRYNGNGADGGEDMTSHYLTTTNTGNLKTNTYTKTGSVFMGWNTEPDGSGVSYTDGQLMNTLEASKTPLTLYAQWN